MLVELKNGETLNGHLVMCDTWMNLTLKEVVQTSPVRYLAPIAARDPFNRLRDTRKLTG
jgi:small nuclear ribonucleoprotein (snRNP)-like protein